MISKKNAIILILVIFLIALGSLLWFYFSFNTGIKQPTTTTTPSTDTYDPFGTNMNNIDVTIATSTDNTNNNTVIVDTTPDRLRRISSEPISGFTVLDNKKTSKTDIRYILRANGNIYETYSDSLELRRLSITTIPKVYESQWLPNGNNLIIRYLKNDNESIETFSVKINPATTTLNEFEGGVDGNHLIEKITTLAINPAGDKIFYLVNNLNGSVGVISKPDGLDKKIIFESPLVEWLSTWPKEEIVTLNTKASYKIPGYLYFLNTKTGDFSKVIGNLPGLTSKTNPTATEVLYSDSTRNIPRLYLYNIKNKEAKLLSWNTLAEKCIWGKENSKIIYCAVPNTIPNGQYPDDWYQGLVSFSDSIWMLDTETGASTLVLDMEKTTGIKLDIVEMQISPKDDILLFMNKTDLSFWGLTLKDRVLSI